MEKKEEFKIDLDSIFDQIKETLKEKSLTDKDVENIKIMYFNLYLKILCIADFSDLK